MNTPAPQLVFGDDGSAAADVVWLWINNHRLARMAHLRRHRSQAPARRARRN